MSRARTIAQAGMIAAVYGGLTLVTVQFLGVLAWGPIQLRVSEAATVLAFFTPAAIPGLTLGSVVANLYAFASTGSPLALLDVVFGSLGTLLGRPVDVAVSVQHRTRVARPGARERAYRAAVPSRCWSRGWDSTRSRFWA